MSSSDKRKGEVKTKGTIEENIKAINELVPNVFTFTGTSKGKFIRYNAISSNRWIESFNKKYRTKEFVIEAEPEEE